MQRMRQQRANALMALGFMAVTLLTVGSAHAASGNGPYYATPSWDQKLPCTAPSTCPRLVVLTDWNSEAVLGRNTGLVWEKTPEETPRTWGDAKFFCVNRTTGGQKGWRLPSVPELASLVDPSVASPGPTLPPGHPFTNVQSTFYWSATASAEDATAAWFVDFSNGFVGILIKTSFIHAWCVRGGMTADVY